MKALIYAIVISFVLSGCDSDGSSSSNSGSGGSRIVADAWFWFEDGVLSEWEWDRAESGKPSEIHLILPKNAKSAIHMKVGYSRPDDMSPSIQGTCPEGRDECGVSELETKVLFSHDGVNFESRLLFPGTSGNAYDLYIKPSTTPGTDVRYGLDVFPAMDFGGGSWMQFIVNKNDGYLHFWSLERKTLEMAYRSFRPSEESDAPYAIDKDEFKKQMGARMDKVQIDLVFDDWNAQAQVCDYDLNGNGLLDIEMSSGDATPTTDEYLAIKLCVEENELGLDKHFIFSIPWIGAVYEVATNYASGVTNLTLNTVDGMIVGMPILIGGESYELSSVDVNTKTVGLKGGLKNAVSANAKVLNILAIRGLTDGDSKILVIQNHSSNLSDNTLGYSKTVVHELLHASPFKLDHVVKESNIMGPSDGQRINLKSQWKALHGI